MAQASSHPGPCWLAGLAPASHLGLATSLGSKVEAGPPHPCFPSLQLHQGRGWVGGGRRWLKLQGPALGVCTRGHTCPLSSATRRLAGTCRAGATVAPPPSQGTQAPLHVCEGRHTSAHMHRHTRVLRGGELGSVCQTAHSPESQGPRTLLGKGDGDVAGGVRAAEASHSPPQQLPVPG